ncbi:MAG: GNAT family N-acetyltransferase [Phenylobacterium sp.]|uniref:GNAT family N-acetyltransferase n=1 Tax=Phenylobacterium sp. TaxID=1871053 RepID=UPI002736D722|nr:GNAT family N-acetyltransferase [Phenylobacterium sp.]MDP3175969.1 GNAT family N-acetyltransferase [Phenylobacterium sp.]
MGFVIFPAGPSDAEDLAAVHVRAWRETYPGMLPEAYLSRLSVPVHARRWRFALKQAEPTELTLAAADRSGLVGYAGVGSSRRAIDGEAEIHTLYLLRAAQGFGLGRRLVADAARLMAARGFGSMRISTLSDNRRARSFYEHLGGAVQAERPEAGPGGVMFETAYLWPRIGALFE